MTTPFYSLHNLDNYNNDVSKYDARDIITKYRQLIMEYLLFIMDTMPNFTTSHNKFIILRGLKTITHVFNIIFYYSRNLDMALYYGQKSYYFYIEFITQVTGGQQSFLQLSSRDAILFVYKKSIFDINNEYRKAVNNAVQPEDTKRKFNILNTYITCVSRITNQLFNGVSHPDSLKNNINKLNAVLCKLNPSSIELFRVFIDKLYMDENTESYFEQLEEFTKKASIVSFS